MTPKLGAAHRWAIALSVAAGLALLVIGIRFLLSPNEAARFFGLANPPGPFDFQRVIALRDIWLALLLIALAALREWRALAICLALGAAVCIADAAVVQASSGRASALAFHLASGLYCVALAAWCWRLARPDH